MDDSSRAIIQELQAAISAASSAASGARADINRLNNEISQKEREKEEINQMITAIERGKIRDDSGSRKIAKCKG